VSILYVVRKLPFIVHLLQYQKIPEADLVACLIPVLTHLSTDNYYPRDLGLPVFFIATYIAGIGLSDFRNTRCQWLFHYKSTVLCNFRRTTYDVYLAQDKSSLSLTDRFFFGLVRLSLYSS